MLPRTVIRRTVRPVIVLPVLALAPILVGCDAPDRSSADEVSAMSSPRQTDSSFEHRARGTFEPTVTPVETDSTPEGIDLGRFSLVKRFHGDLEGTAEGSMLTAVTGEEGSAGYVAIERVDGTLAGRRGTFLLQHDGLMDRGAQHLTITVIPGSGSGELEGLRGVMTIEIAEGVYSYELAFSFE